MTRLDLMMKFLEEGKKLKDKDPIQASEKLYKASEEAVKLLAFALNLTETLKKVDERGRWTMTDLENVVKRLSKKNRDVVSWWSDAYFLHVWGFHENKLDGESVELRLPSVEKIVNLAIQYARAR